MFWLYRDKEFILDWAKIDAFEEEKMEKESQCLKEGVADIVKAMSDHLVL